MSYEDKARRAFGTFSEHLSGTKMLSKEQQAAWDALTPEEQQAWIAAVKELWNDATTDCYMDRW